MGLFKVLLENSHTCSICEAFVVRHTLSRLSIPVQIRVRISESSSSTALVMCCFRCSRPTGREGMNTVSLTYPHGKETQSLKSDHWASGVL
ncbi:hypothetical protein TNCV_4083981 [Trichonephila clavipes]|nr:hypothetical protein TNCV_4083981 [Trichonephila clavipes]